MKCTDCLKWEAHGGTVVYCTACKNDGRYYGIRPACFNLPPDHCIPATARQIYDMGRPKLNDREREQADGVARAVDRLNSGEHRYGFMNSYRRNP